MSVNFIKVNVEKLLREIPREVGLVAAAKTRTPEEVKAAVDAGIRIIGENYVQEALQVRSHMSRDISFHFIGHLQKNKVKKAVEVFDLIETVDSVEIASEIDKRSRNISKVMPVLVEVNSAREINKNGIMAEDAEGIMRRLAELSGIRVMGLMTMGPLDPDPENIRPFFKETKKLFDHIASLGIPQVQMRWLSMGMSDSYRVAIEEGSNLVRVGTGIFGERT